MTVVVGLLLGISGDWRLVLLGAPLWAMVWCILVTARGRLAEFEMFSDGSSEGRLGFIPTFYVRQFRQASLLAFAVGAVVLIIVGPWT